MKTFDGGSVVIIVATFMLLLVTFIAGSVEGWQDGAADQRKKLEQHLVDQGVALYCPKDAHWALIGQCDKEVK